MKVVKYTLGCGMVFFFTFFANDAGFSPKNNMFFLLINATFLQAASSFCQ